MTTNHRGHEINGEPHNHPGCDKCYRDLWSSFVRLQKDYIDEMRLRQNMERLLTMQSKELTALRAIVLATEAKPGEGK